MIAKDATTDLELAASSGHHQLALLAFKAALQLLRPLLAWLWRRRQARRARVIEGDTGPFVWRREQTSLGPALVLRGRGGNAQNLLNGHPGPRLDR
jgi:hypothetical protein